MRRVLVLAVVVGAWAVAVPSWAGTIDANVADGILTVNGMEQATTSPFGARVAR